MKPLGTRTIAAPQEPKTARIVEVFFPTSAPHLAPIAREIQTAVEREIDKLFGDPARATRFYHSVGDAARALGAFARFRAALGAQIECSTTETDED